MFSKVGKAFVVRNVHRNQRKFEGRICVTILTLQHLLQELDSAGLHLVACDFTLSSDRASRIESLDELADFELQDLTAVSQIFFTCDGQSCSAFGSFNRVLYSNYGFDTDDRRKFHLIEGIFKDFERKCQSLDDKAGFLSPDAPDPVLPPSMLHPLEEVTLISESQKRPAEEADTTVAQRVGIFADNAEEVRAQSFWSRHKLGTAVAILGAAATVGGTFFAMRQSRTAESGLDLEGKALFSLQLDTSSSVTTSTEYKYINYTLRNDGRGAASHLLIICGDPVQDGPHGGLGTIGPGTSKPVHMKVSLDQADFMHSGDVFCWSRTYIYLKYDDATGAHLVKFDQYGNAQETADLAGSK